MDFEELVLVKEIQPSAKLKKERKDLIEKQKEQSSASKAVPSTTSQAPATKGSDVDAITHQLGALTLPLQAQTITAASIAREIMKFWPQSATMAPMQAENATQNYQLLQRPPAEFASNNGGPPPS